jgi:hypothetical protein
MEFHDRRFVLDDLADVFNGRLIVGGSRRRTVMKKDESRCDQPHPFLSYTIASQRVGFDTPFDEDAITTSQPFGGPLSVAMPRGDKVEVGMAIIAGKTVRRNPKKAVRGTERRVMQLRVLCEISQELDAIDHSRLLRTDW